MLWEGIDADSDMQPMEWDPLTNIRITDSGINDANKERTQDNSKEAEGFHEQFNTRSAEYVEEILSPHFGGILQFVKEGEVLVDKGQADELKNHEKKALALVQSFSAGWKRSLEELNREILSSFPNLVTGSSLLQLALTQYYHRFQKLLTPNARAQLTNIHHMKVELKKYKTNF